MKNDNRNLISFVSTTGLIVIVILLSFFLFKNTERKDNFKVVRPENQFSPYNDKKTRINNETIKGKEPNVFSIKAKRNNYGSHSSPNGLSFFQNSIISEEIYEEEIIEESIENQIARLDDEAMQLEVAEMEIKLQNMPQDIVPVLSEAEAAEIERESLQEDFSQETMIDMETEYQNEIEERLNGLLENN